MPHYRTARDGVRHSTASSMVFGGEGDGGLTGSAQINPLEKYHRRAPPADIAQEHAERPRVEFNNGYLSHSPDRRALAPAPDLTDRLQRQIYEDNKLHDMRVSQEQRSTLTFRNPEDCVPQASSPNRWWSADQSAQTFSMRGPESYTEAELRRKADNYRKVPGSQVQPVSQLELTDAPPTLPAAGHYRSVHGGPDRQAKQQFRWHAANIDCQMQAPTGAYLSDRVGDSSRKAFESHLHSAVDEVVFGHDMDGSSKHGHDGTFPLGPGSLCAQPNGPLYSTAPQPIAGVANEGEEDKADGWQYRGKKVTGLHRTPSNILESGFSACPAGPPPDTAESALRWSDDAADRAQMAAAARGGKRGNLPHRQPMIGEVGMKWDPDDPTYVSRSQMMSGQTMSGNKGGHHHSPPGDHMPTGTPFVYGQMYTAPYAARIASPGRFERRGFENGPRDIDLAHMGRDVHAMPRGAAMGRTSLTGVGAELQALADAARPQQHSGYGGGLKCSTSAPVLPMDKLARKGKPPGIPACKTMLHWENS